MTNAEGRGNFWEEAPLTNLFGDMLWAMHAWIHNLKREDWRKLKVDKIYLTNRNSVVSAVQDKRSPKYRLVSYQATEKSLDRTRLMEEYSYLP